MNARLLITAGRGPAECHLVVVRVADILTAEARAVGLTATAEPSSPARATGRPSIVLDVTGTDATRWAATVVGPVQWIAPSPLRPQHGRRNWFVQVNLLDERDGARSRPTFDARDVTFRPVRCGGPGGQRRNKVATAVRAEHAPSGRTVVASTERTLSANKAVALTRLAELASSEQRERERRRAEQLWANHDRVTRGDAVRVIRSPLTPPPTNGARKGRP